MNRLPMLLVVLALSLLLLASVRANTTELTNESVSEYTQPCYHKSTTRVLENNGIVTWCDVNMDKGYVTCTSAAEPTYCAE